MSSKYFTLSSVLAFIMLLNLRYLRVEYFHSIILVAAGFSLGCSNLTSNSYNEKSVSPQKSFTSKPTKQEVQRKPILSKTTDFDHPPKDAGAYRGTNSNTCEHIESPVVFKDRRRDIDFAVGPAGGLIVRKDKNKLYLHPLDKDGKLRIEPDSIETIEIMGSSKIGAFALQDYYVVIVFKVNQCFRNGRGCFWLYTVDKNGKVIDDQKYEKSNERLFLKPDYQFLEAIVHKNTFGVVWFTTGDGPLSGGHKLYTVSINSEGKLSDSSWLELPYSENDEPTNNCKISIESKSAVGICQGDFDTVCKTDCARGYAVTLDSTMVFWGKHNYSSFRYLGLVQSVSLDGKILSGLVSRQDQMGAIVKYDEKGKFIGQQILKKGEIPPPPFDEQVVDVALKRQNLTITYKTMTGVLLCKPNEISGESFSNRKSKIVKFETWDKKTIWIMIRDKKTKQLSMHLVTCGSDIMSRTLITPFNLEARLGRNSARKYAYPRSCSQGHAHP
ncbi:MAG: hypothetical protein GY854_15125 [Deltaproteobacteria bacterium]|nr:hypothetical protein [Deltaproteobacteria bacterium]